MNPGHLFTTLIAFTLLVGAPACRQATDPAMAMTVDSLLSVNNSALLTLQELDDARYDHLDSIFQQQRPQFAARFLDTLLPSEADHLGSQFLVLRDALRMGQNQRALIDRLNERSDRLSVLELDLSAGAISTRELEQAIALERTLLEFDHAQVLSVIENYRAAQRAWELRDTVTALLAVAPPNADQP